MFLFFAQIKHQIEVLPNLPITRSLLTKVYTYTCCIRIGVHFNLFLFPDFEDDIHGYYAFKFTEKSRLTLLHPQGEKYAELTSKAIFYSSTVSRTLKL